jgi:hypothetical protein
MSGAAPYCEESAFKPSDSLKKDLLFGHASLTEELSAALFGYKAEVVHPRHGLLVVAGATSTGKSNITRGIIHDFLRRDRDSGKTCQHLLSFEDPIEVPFFTSPTDPLGYDLEAGRKKGVVQTARECGVDTTDLKTALKDALREKPTVFYVGEVREPEEWRLILEYAGTGHFIVATTHAGSLAELMSKLLHDAGARTPAERGFFASRILGLVHLLKTRVTEVSTKKVRTRFGVLAKPDIVLPSVWRRRGDVLARLVNDYLGSLIPTTLPVKDGDEHTPYLGRGYFAARLFPRCFDEEGTEEEKKDWNRALEAILTQFTLRIFRGD